MSSGRLRIPWGYEDEHREWNEARILTLLVQVAADLAQLHKQGWIHANIYAGAIGIDNGAGSATTTSKVRAAFLVTGDKSTMVQCPVDAESKFISRPASDRTYGQTLIVAPEVREATYAMDKVTTGATDIGSASGSSVARVTFDPSIDIWALGAIGAQLLVGQDDAATAVEKWVSDGVCLRTLLPAMDTARLNEIRAKQTEAPALVSLLERMLSDRPGDRPSAHALLVELAATIKGDMDAELKVEPTKVASAAAESKGETASAASELEEQQLLLLQSFLVDAQISETADIPAVALKDYKPAAAVDTRSDKLTTAQWRRVQNRASLVRAGRMSLLDALVDQLILNLPGTDGALCKYECESLRLLLADRGLDLLMSCASDAQWLLSDADRVWLTTHATSAGAPGLSMVQVAAARLGRVIHVFDEFAGAPSRVFRPLTDKERQKSHVLPELFLALVNGNYWSLGRAVA